MPKKKEKGLEIIVNVGDLLKKGKQSPTPSNPFKGGGTGFPKKKKKKKKKPLGLKGGKGKPERTEKPGVPHGVDKKTQEGGQILNIAKGGSVSKFGMLSVKAGIDNNPNPTQADRIAGATKKMKRGGSASKDKKTKTEAYRKLGKQKYDKGMTPDIGEKGRKSFKKTRVKKKDLVDIAGVIKSTGDRYLGKLGNLKTRFKDKKTAKAAGVEFKAKGGAVDTPKKKRGNYGPNIGKPFKAMGPVGGLPVNKAGTKIMAGRLAKRGYGKARK